MRCVISLPQETVLHGVRAYTDYISCPPPLLFLFYLILIQMMMLHAAIRIWVSVLDGSSRVKAVRFHLWCEESKESWQHDDARGFVVIRKRKKCRIYAYYISDLNPTLTGNLMRGNECVACCSSSNCSLWLLLDPYFTLIPCQQTPPKK